MIPLSQITYVMQSEAFSGTILNLKTSLQHKHVLGALVFFQLKNRTGSVTDAAVINYNVGDIPDNGRVHYYHDSYRINTESIYIEMGGKRFK